MAVTRRPSGGVAAATAALALPLVRRTDPLLPWLIRLIGDLPLEPRQGRLAAEGGALGTLTQSLEPLDILLERAPLRLSDTFIPGYFKHAAVFLGETAATPADNPVLEARREGVRLSPLPSPHQLDALVVLRDETLSQERRTSLLSEAEGEVGKSYDFLFDGSDRQRQFCSKLVAQLFRHLPLRGPARGRSLVVPDDFARLALADSAPIRVTMLFLAGTAVPARFRRRRLGELLGESV